MILLINEQIGVLWGFRQQHWQLWSVRQELHLRLKGMPRVVFIMKPIAQMNISNFPRAKQQWLDWNKIWRQACYFPSPLCYPVVTWSPQNQWEWGQGGWEKNIRIIGFQTHYRWWRSDGMRSVRRGYNDFVDSKVKLFYIGVHMTLAIFLKIILTQSVEEHLLILWKQ